MESASKNSMESSGTITGTPEAPATNVEKHENEDEQHVDAVYFRARLELELRLVRIIRHHLCFGIGFIPVLVWMGIHMTSLKRFSGVCTAIHRESSHSSAEVVYEPKPLDFVSEIISSIIDDVGNAYVVLKGQRNTLAPCTGARYLNGASRIPRSSYSNSCLSSTDEMYLNATCTAADCVPPCRSGPLEDIPIQCVSSLPAFADRGQWVVEVISSNLSITLDPAFSLARLEASFMFKMSSTAVCVVDYVYTGPASERSYLTVLSSSAEEGPTLPFTISVLGVAALSLAFDLTQIISRSRGRNCIPWISLVLYTLCSFVVCLVIVARWLFYDFILRDRLGTLSSSSVVDILDLRSYRMILDCFSYVVVLSASGRLLHVLSAHPKTRIMFEIFFGRITEMLKLFFSLLIVTGYFVFVFSWVRDRDPIIVIQWLVQVPLGVWPLTSENGALVIIFGIFTYHFLVVLFQVIIASGVRQYTPCPTALSLHGDLYLIFRRFLVRKFFSSDPHWPSRQTLISVLSNVETHQRVVTLQNILAEVTKLKLAGTIGTEDFTLRGVEQVWKWYVGHFGSSFLKPKQMDDISVEDILTYVENLPEETESYPQEQLIPVEEIVRRTCELKSILERLCATFSFVSLCVYIEMPSGAVHPNTGNFSRVPRLTVVDRVRKLVAQKAYETRPEWLQFVERAPPMELTNLKLRDNRIKSPYPAMIRYVLEKFPDMRFQDCFVDGNDWSRGNDKFRSDHPVMQFVARQLELMNGGSSRQDAFEQTKTEYLNRRLELEKRQKLEMALAQNKRIVPAFGSSAYPSPIYTTGAGIARQREAELEVAHLNHIRRKLRMLRKEIEPHDRRRMSAKEVALDVEAERVGLLPKLSSSQYQPPKTIQEEIIETEEIEPVEEPVFEFVSGEDEELDVFEPSVRNPRPVDVSWEAMAEQSAKLVSTEQKISPILKTVSEPKTTSTVRLQATKPAFTLSRPDKQTVQAILSKKKQEEIQRRIGKEPGENDDGMDFEDFMNMMNKPK